MTYDLLDSVTLASSASSVTFSSIDQSYGDLVLVVKATGATGQNVAAGMKFNGVTGGYAVVAMAGDGSAAYSFSSASLSTLQSSVYVLSQGAFALNSIIQIFDYAQTDKHKSVLARTGQSGGANSQGAEALAGRFPNTSAVTSIEITSTNGNYASGSAFHLYGVAK